MASWNLLRFVETGRIHTGYVSDAAWNARVHQWTLEEVEPFEFDDEMEFVGYERGRSAAIIKLRGQTQEWLTGLDGLSEMIPHMVNGVIKGRFKFRKQGQQIYVFPVTAR